MGGNCIQGYKINVFMLKEEHNYNSQSIFFGLSAIGDAVKIAIEDEII